MSTSYRTQGRRLTLQVLYSSEFSPPQGEDLMGAFSIAGPNAPSEACDFAQELFQEIYSNREYLDEKLEAASPHWKIDRIHPIERNILRIGLYELTFRPDTPARVALNEAIDLARRFGDDEAWRFINGVLQQLGEKRLELEGVPREDSSKIPSE